MEFACDQRNQEHIFKGMPAYSHGKEQTYHKSEAGWKQKLMLTPSQWFFRIFPKILSD